MRTITAISRDLDECRQAIASCATTASDRPRLSKIAELWQMSFQKRRQALLAESARAAAGVSKHSGEWHRELQNQR